FEHPTLERLARHLALSGRFKPAERTQVERRPAEAGLHANERRNLRRTRAEGPEAIAIVGMSGRFPMAGNVDELWANLVAGRDCITEIPATRWDWREVYGDPALENKTNVKWGGFIEGIDEFDHPFFNISAREAELMDPQQRLLLQHVWKAIEDAGYAP